MKKTLIAFFVFCLTNTAMADNHSITFKQRQASTKMNITAVQITPTSGTISAEGTMGEYGTTYLTYTLTADPDGNGGQVIGEGEGLGQMGHLESEKVPDPTIGMELNLLCIFCLGSMMALRT